MRRRDRRSIRLKGFDYTSPDAYFVTMVTYQREPLFGEVIDGEMRLNRRGEIAAECWRAIPDHFPRVELGAFVIMPEHLYGIIFIKENSSSGTETKEEFGKPVPGSLPTIIRTFKAAVTRQIRREFGELTVWQRNYHEPVIRNDQGFLRIEKYILANPSNWEADREKWPQHKENI